jgi:hypothetical protein
MAGITMGPPVERPLAEPPDIDTLVSRLIGGGPEKLLKLFQTYRESQAGQMPLDRELMAQDMISMMVDRANAFDNERRKYRLYDDDEFQRAPDLGNILYNRFLRGDDV